MLSIETAINTLKEFTMATSSLKYLTIGLRRDKNFSDVQDNTASLNNLLNNLVSTEDTTLSFVSEDLDAIRGLQNTNINSGKLSALADTTVNFSKIQTVPETGNIIIVDQAVVPRSRLKDRVENAYTITNKIPAFAGGQGLDCRFVESTEINVGNRNSTGFPGIDSTAAGYTPNSTGIFDFRDDQITEIFWTSGYFNFASTIDPTFKDSYGGLQWTGWFSPSLRDPDVNLYIWSTGLYIFEVDLREDDNWQTLASVYADERTVKSLATVTSVTTLLLEPGEGKYVAQGDFFGPYSENGPNITILAMSGDSITLDTAVTVQAGQDIIITKILGKTTTVSTIPLPSVEIGNQLKIRVSVWWPDNGQEMPEKTVDFDYIGSQLSYTNLYNEKPSDVAAPTGPNQLFPSSVIGPLEIRTFLNNIVTPYQNTIGGSAANKNFFVNNSALLNYSPVSGFSEVAYYGPVNVLLNDYNNVIRFSTDIGNAVIGNIIVPALSTSPISSLSNKIIQIKDDISSSVRIATQTPGANSTESVYVVNHKGFVDWVYGTVSGNTVTITVGNASKLRKDYIVMSPTTAPNSWIRINTIDKQANIFTTSASLGSGNILILVYSDKSLIDSSKDIFCEGVFAQEIAATVSSGNSMTLKNSTGVVVGLAVQFDGEDPNSPKIPAGTTVTDVSGNTITISNNITGEIKGDSTIVFGPPGTTVNVEGCVVPLNTAPPFVGTPTGLSSANRGIRTVSTNSTLRVIANDIVLDIPASDVTLAASANTFDRKLKLTIGSALYGILAKTV